MSTPPSNVEAEQGLLGAVLANNRAFDDAAWLRAEHFYDPVHATIWDVIAARVNAGRLADAVTLRDHFEAEGTLEEAGGAGYLARLLAAMVSPTLARDYAQAIFATWHRRRLIEIAAELGRAAFETADPVAAQEAAESELFAIAEDRDDHASPAHEAMSQALESAIASAARPDGLVGVTTGFRELDDALGGLRRGDMVVVGARPSMGKTALALGFAAAAAAAQHRVLFVSLEMRREKIGARLLAGLTPIESEAAGRGHVRGRDGTGRFTYEPIGQGDVDRMHAAARAMAERRFVIDECRQRTVAQVRAAARRMKRRGGLDLVLIDYLGLLRVPELARSDNRTLEVTRLSGEVKAMANDLGVPVVLLSQLNRANMQRDDKRPNLADLRDSGSIEQDADVVMFLHREEYYLARARPNRKPGEADDKFANRVSAFAEAERDARGVAEIIIDKNRDGPTGTRRIAWRADWSWFTDLAATEA
ncbi:MAG: AAA family ATPase [Xanthomonadaceae bacterium]|nr:AAA family ATPase [Xanthomonadaceae bacterium]